jgi:o-succinylbenzoate synthase
MFNYRYIKHTLVFNFNAKTSRGEINTHNAYYIIVNNILNNAVYGVGEAAPLLGLSKDATPNFEKDLENILNLLNQGVKVNELDLDNLPSMAFALETAHLDLLNGGNKIIFNSNFLQGTPIAINGLVWMNDLETMRIEAIKKVKEGYNCIKIKIGAHDFDAECRLLEFIRKQFNAFNLEIRVDANGAFAPDDVIKQLKELARFDLHSIEQPIMPGNTEAMHEICRKSKVPVALDEELIHVSTKNAQQLLKNIAPTYIILKPTLLGGFEACNTWINAATKLNIGWWATSALESNIGLNAIAQWVATKNNHLHQGLGTGLLYKNNIQSPLRAEKGYLKYHMHTPWQNQLFTTNNNMV